MASVFSLFPRASRARDWTNGELAELYRVEHALGQANIALEIDRGVTDEGDPWFVFCRHDGEVLVHIARYDGLYHLFSPALPKPLIGPTFSALTRSFVAKVPAKAESSASSNIIRHPSALLSLLVVTVFFSIDYLSGHGGRAEAAALVPAKATGFGRDGAIQSVVSNMLTSMGGPDGESVLESAYLAGQAAVLFIGSGIAVYEQSSFLTAVSGTALATDPTDAAQRQTDALTPPANQFDSAAFSDALSGQSTRANVVAVTNGQISDAAAMLSEPVRTTASTSATALITPLVSAAAITTHAPAALPVEVKEQKAFAPAEQAIVVLASSAGSEINLAGSASTHLIQLLGNGLVTLSGLSGNGLQAIEVLGASTETLRLEFASSTHSLQQTVAIKDGSSLTLQSVSVNGETTLSSVDLTVDSAGSHSNTLTVSDTAIQGAALNLKIIGSQDLILHESAKALAGSSLDASALQGQLTVGVDLGSSNSPRMLVGSSNFVVNNNGIVALINVPNNAAIQVATDLESVLAQFTGAPSDHSLNLGLQRDGPQSNPVAIGIVKVDGTTTLGLESGGDGSVVNTITTVIDPNLQNLEIHGSGSLSIGSILGVTSAATQNITIDASQLGGGLSIDVSGIADVANGGRQITIIGGQGNNVLTNSNGTETTVFVGGSGQNIFNLAAGAQSVAVKGLHVGDTIVVGGGETSDIVVDATRLSSLSTTFLNSLSLKDAAAAASSSTGVSAAHQAVLFEYDNNLYAFVDANGNHAFDAGADALIQIVGMSKPVDLAHVFFSA